MGPSDCMPKFFFLIISQLKAISHTHTQKKNEKHLPVQLNQVARERFLMDVGGHYARPDVFKFSFDASRAANVAAVDGERGEPRKE